MALVITVKEPRPNSVSGQGVLNVQIGPRKRFNIEVTDSADANYNGTGTDPQTVYESAQLPQVGSSCYTYTSEGTQKVCPWVICTRKTVTRNEQNARLWTAEVAYQSVAGNALEEDLYGQPLKAAEKDYGKLVSMTTGEDSRVLWSDLRSDEPSRETLKLPNGRFFADPFMRRISTNRYRIIQLTALGSISEADDYALENLFVMNNAQWKVPRDADSGNGQVAKHHALTIGVQWRPVVVPFVSDPTPQGWNTYLFMWDVDTTESEGGFNDRRALIDTFARPNAGEEPKAVTTAQSAERKEVLLNADGTEAADQDAEPNFKEFQVQKEVDYSVLFPV